MKVFSSISDFNSVKKTIATLGTFDGVHQGHRKIIERLVQSAADQQCESVILTFFPHPRMVLQQRSEIKLLNTIDEKISLLHKTGLDNLIIHPFDESFAALSAEQFVKNILIGQLNIAKIIIGYDHRFGKNRTANIDDLVKYGAEFGFEVEQISAEQIDEVSISSTKIRTALADGNMELANEFLGYPYFLTGTIVHGKQLGRTIGFPTANLQISEAFKQIPKNGVYVVYAVLNAEKIYGMMNIGTRPTVGGSTITIETHFFNFDADLYGTELEIFIVHRLRDEIKFDSVEALKQQLYKDKVDAQSYLRQ